MRILKHIPDVVIASAVIMGAFAFGMGHRAIGGIAMVIAMIVGWKRNWCVEAFTELVGTDGGRVEQSDAQSGPAGNLEEDSDP